MDGLLPPLAAALWEHLRAAVLHYTTLEPWHCVGHWKFDADEAIRREPADRWEAHTHLNSYATILEVFALEDLLSHNLHAMAVHAWESEEAVGSLCWRLEMHIERVIGWAKRELKFKARCLAHTGPVRSGTSIVSHRSHRAVFCFCRSAWMRPRARTVLL
jgi:hypothetical protein